ncbi:cysteine-rich CWC family protein [Paenibacillus mendelii]|uniref:Cysteine-rich CWC family protein n=1 Tax=Paenibacillus mendelii TaxID=206163 RepID=A0ABV6JGK1_9BACL
MYRLMTKTIYIDEQHCPLCGLKNACSGKTGDCWCFHTKIPAELIKRIPEEMRGKVCICRTCVIASEEN